MKLLCFALFLLVAPWPTSSGAEGIPGADDPELRAAAEAWITGEDPRAAYRAIGEIAADGNVAARLLADQLHRWYGRLDFPGSSREERKALFPPDRSGRAEGIFRLYPVDTLRIPPLSLTERMLSLTSPEEWIGRAQALLAAGLREVFLMQLASVLANNQDVDLEAARFAEEVVTDADREAMDLWFFLRREKRLQELRDEYDPGEAAARRARWGGPTPWTARREADFARALRDGRWSAIRAAGLLIGHDNDIPADAETANLYRRWYTLTSYARHGELGGELPPTAAELEELGAVLARDAAQSPYLLPVLHACGSHCPGSVRYYMATGTLSLRGLAPSAPIHLEPILPAAAFYASERAAREILLEIGLTARRFGFGPEGMEMPQCLRDAATRAAALVSPEKP